MPHDLPRFRTASATLLAFGALSLAVFQACTTEPSPTEVEVTREVPVTVEVPATVETVRTVETTREVPVTQEVPVTVAVPQTVEVTRTVESVQQVEVTREVPVTRIVAATPATKSGPTTGPTQAPTPAPTVAVATPAPTIGPEPTAQPEPMPQTGHGDWSVEERNYGSRKMLTYRKDAMHHETAGQPPVLAFQCDTQGFRSLYIDWPVPLVTQPTSVHSADSISLFDEVEWRDHDLNAMVAYAEGLHAFINGLNLDRQEQDEREKVWREVRQLLNPAAQTPEGLMRMMQQRWPRSVEIELEFFVGTETPHPAVEKYGPPILETISEDWIVLSGNRTRMWISGIGSLRQAVRSLKSSAALEVGGQEMMAATLIGPEQLGAVNANWDVGGLSDILDHCRRIQR